MAAPSAGGEEAIPGVARGATERRSGSEEEVAVATRGRQNRVWAEAANPNQLLQAALLLLLSSLLMLFAPHALSHSVTL